MLKKQQKNKQSVSRTRNPIVILITPKENETFLTADGKKIGEQVYTKKRRLFNS